MGVQDGAFAVFESTHLDIYTIWLFEGYYIPNALRTHGPLMVYARPFLNVVNNLIYDKKIEPIVIVFIGVEDRWTEYVSECPEYAKLVTGELVPFIEKNFQVSRAPDKRGIIGASASGHAAFVTALRHPDVFGNIASQGGGGGGYPGLNPIANAALDLVSHEEG